MLNSASSNESGVPLQLLEAKQAELKERREREAAIQVCPRGCVGRCKLWLAVAACGSLAWLAGCLSCVGCVFTRTHAQLLRPHQCHPRRHSWRSSAPRLTRSGLRSRRACRQQQRRPRQQPRQRRRRWQQVALATVPAGLTSLLVASRRPHQMRQRMASPPAGTERQQPQQQQQHRMQQQCQPARGMIMQQGCGGATGASGAAAGAGAAAGSAHGEGQQRCGWAKVLELS
jgi:hypothetical protein